MTSKQVTSPSPWNSRRLVHSKEMVWASRWSVALRTFYRQVLSLLYSSFFFWNFRPRLAQELLVLYINLKHHTCACDWAADIWNTIWMIKPSVWGSEVMAVAVKTMLTGSSHRCVSFAQSETGTDRTDKIWLEMKETLLDLNLGFPDVFFPGLK